MLYSSTNALIPNSLHRLVDTVLKQRIWFLSASTLISLMLLSPTQGLISLAFVLDALNTTAPFLLLSIVLASYAGATGADNLIARAFTGAPFTMVLAASLIGALSPFCSCGVIPLVAGLLAMGVPVSAVMAFWLASPIMDPSMFALTVGMIDWEFAVAKTLAAIGLGLFGGVATFGVERAGWLVSPLRAGIGDGCCGGGNVRISKPIIWFFWRDSIRLRKFRREATSTTVFLLKWLTLAFILESLMIAYVPAGLIAETLGNHGPATIGLAALVGVPAYLNGYAALPLVSGLMDQGLSEGAAMSFLVAGGVSSLPAAIAVWALVRPPTFLLYLVLALTGSFTVGLAYQAWIV